VEALASTNRLAVDERAVEREAIVHDHPLARDPADLGVCPRDPIVPGQRDVGRWAATKHDAIAAVGEYDDDLASILVAVDEKREPGALRVDMSLQLRA
jgi:hypothetical protein